MDKQKRQQLAALYEKNKEHDRQQPDRLNRWRSIEPESAALLSIFVRSMQVKHMLEIGTSNGYSTLWLKQWGERLKGRFALVEVFP